MPKPKRKCIFNDDWMRDDHFKQWLQKGSDIHSAKCSLCYTTIDIASMGKSAIESHSTGKKHLKALDRRNSLSTLCFQKQQKEQSASQQGTTSATTQNVTSLPLTSTVSSLIVKSGVSRAEILWVLKIVKSHFSFRSCEDTSELFKVMFSDSTIAKFFSLGKTKCAYYVNFGLAPYFKDQLVTTIKSSDFFAVSYDESMNHVLQEEQMDIIVRFWDDDEGMVKTRYLDSKFLKCPNCQNLLLKL